MRIATAVILALLLGSLPASAQDSKTRTDLATAYQAALDAKDEVARKHIFKRFVAIGRPAYREIKAAREAWNAGKGRQLAKMESVIKQLSQEREALETKITPNPVDRPVIENLSKDIEAANRLSEPLKLQRMRWDELEEEVAKAVVPQVGWMPEDKTPDPMRCLMLAYLSAMTYGDEAARKSLFDVLLKTGREGVAEARVARGAWRRGNSARLGEFLKAEASLRGELNAEAPRSKEMSDKERRLIERLDTAQSGAKRLQGEIDHLDWLENELDLRATWREGKPLLDGLRNAARSFNYFARSGRWVEAATCVQPPTEEQARKLFKGIESAVPAGAGAEGWQLASIHVPGTPSLDRVLLVAPAIRECFSLDGGRIMFEGATAILTFEEAEDKTLRLSRSSAGELFDPRKE